MQNRLLPDVRLENVVREQSVYLDHVQVSCQLAVVGRQRQANSTNGMPYQIVAPP